MNRRQRHLLYPAAWAVLLVVGGVWLGMPAAHAQDQTRSLHESTLPHWQLLFDGEPATWPGEAPAVPIDSLQPVAQRLLGHLRRRGHYYARIDSVAADTGATPPTVHMYARRGPRVAIDEIRIEGAKALSPEELRTLMDTQKGEPLVSDRLEADLQVLLDRYEEEGHPLAQIRVKEVQVEAEDPSALRLTLNIDEGPALWLKGIEVPENARTSPRLLAHLADLEVGAPLENYDPEAIQQNLRDTNYFRKVGLPELKIASDGGAHLHIPVEEASPGTFDVVLGYLPPSGTREGGTLVGSGHLLLEHLFGGGRRAEFTLDRRPNQTSIFDLALEDPFLFGAPVRGEGQFRGEQRDSTYGKRVYRLDAGYRLGGGMEATISVSREVVRPGQAGARIENGDQRIPRSTSLFYGVGVRYEQIDQPHSPRRGLVVEARAERGRKQQQGHQVTDTDTSRAHRSLRQERLQSRLRAYFPVSDRQVLVGGGEASVLLSSTYDRSDLYRIGGATSLRGYDEDRFLGHVTARGLLEYRLQFDRRSYAYLFGDLGYVRRPALNTLSATQGWHPGYGVGLQVQTGIGLLTTSYALHPDVRTPAHGRVHLGLFVSL